MGQGLRLAARGSLTPREGRGMTNRMRSELADVADGGYAFRLRTSADGSANSAC
jgi:hypothetical protein